MLKLKYKVLITTSGLGTRLGDLTKYTNKSLVRVGKKPALAYIIESYPNEIELVITLGHFGDQVKNFVQIAYPERKVTFVQVDKYRGPGTSLGYSMLQAKKYLQIPFIYHAGDTIVTKKIPAPAKNWIGGFKGQDAASYASITTTDGRVQMVNKKGALNFDYLHIGIAGIHNWQEFWLILQNLYKKNPLDSTLNDCSAIELMLQQNYEFYINEFPVWYDVGNVEALNFARKNITDASAHVLDKVDESIFIFDKFVIKFFYNQQIVKERIKRAQILNKLVPKIEATNKNFYRYKYVRGNLYSRAVTPNNFQEFLNWAKTNLWKRIKEVSKKQFKQVCLDFYRKKTIERIKKFWQLTGITDQANIINKETVPGLKDIFKKVDFKALADTTQYQFHGDFILDNIIKTASGYSLLDWRQNFGGLLKTGDMYYDLAKLNHNLIVNHDIVNANLFTARISKNNIVCDIMRKDNLVQCQEVLFDFIKKNNHDLQKIKVLTPLIWLNMSPLHHHPFNLFLYYFGKLNLWRAIKKN